MLYNGQVMAEVASLFVCACQTNALVCTITSFFAVVTMKRSMSKVLYILQIVAHQETGIEVAD
jgi:hypothetical protein